MRIERESAAATAAFIADNHPQCMLWKLPLELREEIFGLVLGVDRDSTLHLISRAQRVGHVRCSEKSCHLHPQCVTAVNNATYLYLEDSRDAPKISHIELALLQTCKRAYREGIHFLYSRPMFAFNHPETLNWFARTVAPRRLTAITRMSISLSQGLVSWQTPMKQTVPFRKEQPRLRLARNDGDLLRYWDPAWRTILCDMTNLKYLVVILIGPKFDDPDYTEPVLKPLLELRGLMTFQFLLHETATIGDEAARLEHLKERSETLRTILERATSGGDGRKKKAGDLDWMTPPPELPAKKKRRKWKRSY